MLLDLELLNKIIKENEEELIKEGKIVYIPMAIKLTEDGHIGMTICDNGDIISKYNKEISKRKYNL